MRKILTLAVAVGALAVAPGSALADEEGSCGSHPVTTTYHELHEVPEPVAEAAGLGEQYEAVAHKQVECGEGEPPLDGAGLKQIFG